MALLPPDESLYSSVMRLSVHCRLLFRRSAGGVAVFRQRHHRVGYSSFDASFHGIPIIQSVQFLAAYLRRQDHTLKPTVIVILARPK